MTTRPTHVPWPLVVLAAYLVPGAGHVLYGERRRGLVIGVSVVVLFVLGVWVGGVRVVELPDLAAGTLLGKLLSQPAFLGQFFAGPIALLAGWWSKSLASDPSTAAILAHARLFDIAQLYTAVAGALNLLAILDIGGRALDGAEPRPDRFREGSGQGRSVDAAAASSGDAAATPSGDTAAAPSGSAAGETSR